MIIVDFFCVKFFDEVGFKLLDCVNLKYGFDERIICIEIMRII